ncbi:glycosyltransferase family 2 protein [Komagataeibacter swingsii]|uniref:Glycosyltransferase n=1 Tax=Komagataeibacter swingsii TaxID=215220 RepID=A0A2V4RQR4_9PROT|nr:glycosyltransferase family 2 protein [Komagataeibacter swingsii]PYD69962.1 glycosyltransferase [Komagataeibacter swingsii]GBQ61740.1 glycosyltransferase [Komagataeibacter swingsii DSM 16373]
MNSQPPSLPRLAIIVPCYNESEVFSYCLTELGGYLDRLIGDGMVSPGSYLLFVDDGSRDDTWRQISNAIRVHAHVRGLKLSCNKGHQAALLTGLANADNADAIVSIDADLQDDINAIGEMVKSYAAGHDVVYGVRASRQTDTAFKRMTAEVFYRLMTVMGVKQVFNHADFRLLSCRARDALLEYHERNIYIRGLVPLIGFPSAEVYYDRKERTAGVSKYPLHKMMALALEGITSMTVMPLRIITLTGFIISATAIMAIMAVLINKMIGNPIQGWASVIVALFFMGGVQMLCLGIIGEYLGKIYLETKRRPRSHIEEKAGFNNS